jgi:cytochrome c
MKQTLFALLTTAAFVAPAFANQDLAKNKRCMNCHSLEKKIVGPAYKDIAKKYAGQDVTAKLATKMIKGGAGTWGVIPMPANPQVTQAEAETLVKWVLSLK